MRSEYIYAFAILFLFSLLSDFSHAAEDEIAISYRQLEETAEVENIAVTVLRYEETSQCRSSFQGRPARGAKLVYVWLKVQNISQNEISAPSFVVNLEGIERDSGWFGGTVCLYDDEALGNSCYEDQGSLYPGVSCEGWELFQVPEAMEISGKILKVYLNPVYRDLELVGHWEL